MSTVGTTTSTRPLAGMVTRRTLTHAPAVATSAFGGFVGDSMVTGTVSPATPSTVNDSAPVAHATFVKRSEESETNLRRSPRSAMPEVQRGTIEVSVGTRGSLTLAMAGSVMVLVSALVSMLLLVLVEVLVLLSVLLSV